MNEGKVKYGRLPSYHRYDQNKSGKSKAGNSLIFLNGILNVNDYSLPKYEEVEPLCEHCGIYGLENDDPCEYCPNSYDGLETSSRFVEMHLKPNSKEETNVSSTGVMMALLFCILAISCIEITLVWPFWILDVQSMTAHGMYNRDRPHLVNIQTSLPVKERSLHDLLEFESRNATYDEKMIELMRYSDDDDQDIDELRVEWDKKRKLTPSPIKTKVRTVTVLLNIIALVCMIVTGILLLVSFTFKGFGIDTSSRNINQYYMCIYSFFLSGLSALCLMSSFFNFHYFTVLNDFQKLGICFYLCGLGALLCVVVSIVSLLSTMRFSIVVHFTKVT